jgi:hypothetical protein
MVISLVEAGAHLVSQPPTPWAVPLSVIRSPCALFGRMANHYLDDDCGMLDGGFYKIGNSSRQS